MRNNPLLRYGVVGFVLLFPAHFLYHVALALTLIPPFLGGFINEMTIFLAAYVVWAYSKQLSNWTSAVTAIDLAFLLFVLYFLLVVAINFVLDSDPSVIELHLASIAQLVVVFLIFRVANFDDTTTKKTLVFLLAVMIVLTFALSVDGVFLIDNRDTDLKERTTYQGFARSIFFAILVTTPFLSSKHLRRLIFLAGIASLFLIGSRAELLAAFLAAALIEILFSDRRGITGIVIIVFLAFATLLFDSISSRFAENRIWSLLYFGEDGSYIQRAGQISFALDSIADSPIFGDYGSYVTLGNRGNYAHNILSAWVDLGFIGFAWLVTMLLYPLFVLLPHTIRSNSSRKNGQLRMAFTLLVVTIALQGIAHTFTNILVGAALGAVSNFLRSLASADSAIEVKE